MKLRLLPVSVLLFALGVSCSHSASYYVDRGNKLFAQGKYVDAVISYRKGLQKTPGSAELYYRAALAELKINKGPEAFQDLNQANRVDPRHLGTREELGSLALTTYLVDARRPKALYDLLVKLSQQWLTEDPNSPEGLRIKGYLAMTERRPEEASALFVRANAANPNEVKIALGLVDALFQSKQIAQAEQAGLDFVSRNPAAGDMYDALYRLYSATDRPAEAQSILIRKVAANPKEGEYILQLAAHYARTGNKAETNATLKRFLDTYPGDNKAHLKAGDFYASLGDWPGALDQYQAGATAASGKEKVVFQDRLARAMLSENKRDEGLKLLNETLSEDPDDEEARALRAAVLMTDAAPSKADESLKEFQSLVERHPDDLLLKFVAAKARLEKSDLTGARAQLIEIVGQRPRFVDAQMMLADISFQQGKLTEVVQFADAALEADPSNPRARMLKGSALRRLRNFDAAGAILDGLAREVPDSIDLRLELAYLALDTGRFPESEAAFKKILERKPNEWRALSGLVDLDMARNQKEQAFERLDQELKHSGGAAPVRYLLAVTALRSGRYDLAIQHFRQLADASTGSIDAHLRLAEVYRLKGDLLNAIAILQKASVLRPDDPRPPSLLPFLLDKLNHKHEAALVAEAALRKHPDDANAMNNLAFLLAETGDNLDEALKLARQAVRSQPENAAFSDTLGYVYLKRDQNDDALEIFGKLARRYPEDPTCAYHMGMAWFQKGNLERAKENLARALDERPPTDLEPEIHDLLKRIKG